MAPTSTRATWITSRRRRSTWSARRRTWRGCSSIAARGSTSSWRSGCATRSSSSAACATTPRRSIIAPGRASTRWRTTASGRRRARKSAIGAATSTGGCSTTTSRPSRRPRLLGYDDIVELLLRHASPAQRLLAACASGRSRRGRGRGRRASGRRGRPRRPTEMRLIADKAHANETAAVALMLDLGFDARVIGPDNGDALHWAAFHGNAGMVRTAPAARSADRRPGRRPRRHAAGLVRLRFGAAGGARARAISPPPRGCCSTRANGSIPPTCRPAATMWMPCCGRTSRHRLGTIQRRPDPAAPGSDPVPLAVTRSCLVSYGQDGDDRKVCDLCNRTWQRLRVLQPHLLGSDPVPVAVTQIVSDSCTARRTFKRTAAR